MGAGGVGVAGVGAGDAVAEVPLDPGEGGVAEPVGGDAPVGDPGEVVTKAVPEVVVAAGSHGAAGGGMVNEAVGERGGDGVPPGGAAFLTKL